MSLDLTTIDDKPSASCPYCGSIGPVQIHREIWVDHTIGASTHISVPCVSCPICYRTSQLKKPEEIEDDIVAMFKTETSELEAKIRADEFDHGAKCHIETILLQAVAAGAYIGFGAEKLLDILHDLHSVRLIPELLFGIIFIGIGLVSVRQSRRQLRRANASYQIAYRPPTKPEGATKG